MEVIKKDKKPFSIFCEKCDNILDIARSIDKKDIIAIDSATPEELSSDSESGSDAKSDVESDAESHAETDSASDAESDAGSRDLDDVDYEALLKKIEEGKKLSSDELKSIDIKNMVKNEYYKKMAKKGEIKKNIMDMIEDMGNSDENTQAYMVCKNCSFSKSIDPGFKVLSKNPDGITSTNDYVNESSYRNKVHLRTMPITRNFNCPNKDCPVYKNKLAPEAIFFRKNANTHETIYVCKRCLTIKMN
jgi:hypothetical protein